MTSEELLANASFDLNARPMITDVFPSGTTVLYGRPGSGKTQSTIKNLNRFGKKPYLVDFDNNNFLKGEFSHLNGYKFIDLIKPMKKQTQKTLLNNNYKHPKVIWLFDRFLMRADKIVTRNNDNQTPNPLEGFKANQVHEAINCFYKEVAKDATEAEMINLKSDMIETVEEIKDTTPVETLPSGNIFIIDTYVQCMNYLKNDFQEFKSICELIVNECKNDLIIIDHEYVDKPDSYTVDEKFINHCEGKLRLKHDITKTKGEEVHLFVQKVRGFNGNPLIKNWERN